MAGRSRCFSAFTLGVLMTMVAGCASIGERFGNEDQTRTVAVDVGLDTVDWAVFDGMASVLVRNGTDHYLRRADAIVRVLDQKDITLGSSTSMPEQGHCCAATNVAPGGTFGFYFSVGDRGDQIDHVEVDYADVAWSEMGATSRPGVTGEPVELYSDDTGAVAVADLVTTGGLIPQAVVQARLDDADGDFLAVVSGRWTCLTPAAPTRAFLQFYHPLPAGTRLSSVVVYPVDDGPDAIADTDPPADCG